MLCLICLFFILFLFLSFFFASAERLDAASRAARDRFLAQKHALVHQRKHDQAQRARLRQLDKELDAKELKQSVHGEHSKALRSD